MDGPFGEYQGEAQYGVQPPPIALAFDAPKTTAAMIAAPNRIFDMARPLSLAIDPPKTGEDDADAF